jgi:hypothetical protein
VHGQPPVLDLDMLAKAIKIVSGAAKRDQRIDYRRERTRDRVLQHRINKQLIPSDHELGDAITIGGCQTFVKRDLGAERLSLRLFGSDGC